MMQKIIKVISGGGLVLMGSMAYAEPNWSYTGESAPDKWAHIKQEFNRCEGFNQSPIDVKNTVKSSIPALKFSYQSTAKSIVNNGHTVQVNFNEGSALYLDGEAFHLKQFHIHTPSENQIEGKSYPLEAHFVHMNRAGALAVVGIMYAEGLENLPLAKLWTQLPKEHNVEQSVQQTVVAAEFLPTHQQYYRFNGSLTTPPCTEGVRWLLLKDIQTASTAQIKAFSELMPYGNSRPVQPVNARIILESP